MRCLTTLVFSSLCKLPGRWAVLIPRSNGKALRRHILVVYLVALALSCAMSAQEARWNELNQRVSELYQQGKYAEATPLAEEALRVAEATFGSDHKNVATALNNLALLYDDQGKYAEAEPLYRRSLAIREKTLGPDHPDVAQALNNVAALYYTQGKYAEAEPLYRRSLAIREKTLGPDHPDVASTLNNLAALYDAQGKYAEAEPLYRRSLAIHEKALGPDHPDVAIMLNNLAELYRDQGKYAEAEPLYRRSLAIREKTLGPDHPDVATALNNLAGLYDAQGKYAEAEPLYRRSLAIVEKTLGSDHPDVANTLSNLAELYFHQDRYAEAEPLYRRSLAIQEKALGPDHPDVANTLNNLAALYYAQGKYAEAEPLYRRSLAIREKTLGPDHPDVANTLNNLAALYYDQAKYAEAEPLYRRSLAIVEKTLGPDHPAVANTLNNLAVLYYAQGRYAEAEPFFDRGLANLARQFEYYFSYMSEKERLQFLGKVAYIFPATFSFFVSYQDKDPLLAGKMFDVLLWEKGFIGQSMAALRVKIAASGDQQALKLLDDLAARKTALATLLNSQPKDREAWKKQVAELGQQADELEKELVKRSSAFQEQGKLATVTWREVRKALKPGEAAVEVVQFEFYDGKKWTGRFYYVALVVKPESNLPQLIVLDNGTQPAMKTAPSSQTRVEKAMQDYQELAKLAKPESVAPGAAREFYQTFWKPLEAALGDARTIYLAPDGVLNQVALGIVPAADGKLLVEKYDLRIVTNTKDLLRPTHLSPQKTATLVGNPRFLLSEDGQMKAIAALHAPAAKPFDSPTARPEGAEPVLLASAAASPMSGVRSRDLERSSANCPELPVGGVLCPLPSTAAEIGAIEKQLKGKSWVVAQYHDEQALEEAVKAARHPRLLHLATHGFFLSDQQVKRRQSLGGEQATGLEDPMLRSGLLLAGADRILKHELPLPDADDGVLTAYEASTLDLNGTELVVLSACETGLGQARAGEGVFGLRRAFEVAGAESILMSMWKVPDRETEELMAAFYTKWLAGMEKHQALRQAQMELRQQIITRQGHDVPYYWGAWVLVGK